MCVTSWPVVRPGLADVPAPLRFAPGCGELQVARFIFVLQSVARCGRLML
jgi:hypothetical protein